jgi:hypothetical protein
LAGRADAYPRRSIAVNGSRRTALHRLIQRFVPLLGLCLAGCTDNTLSPTSLERVVVVLNRVGPTLTVVPIGNSTVRSILLSQGDPTTIAVRGSLALVPLGATSAAARVDLETGAVILLSLPDGSGATGASFITDSTAVVANPRRNTVVPVNLARATVGAEVAVGEAPRAVVSDGARVMVLNARLTEDGTPLGPGTVTVLEAATLQRIGTVQLSGVAPVAGAVRGGRLFVLNAGTPGGGNSSLSVVDLTSLEEIRRVDGLGDQPGSVSTLGGLPVYVGAWSTGVLVYDPDLNRITRGLTDPLVAGERLPLSSARLDDNGLLYTLHPGDCTRPGAVLQLSPLGAVLAQAETGICPFALGFGSLPLR